MNKINSLLVVGLILGVLFSGMSGFTYNAKAVPGNWVEEIISDTGSSVDDICVGDADNDGDNEIVYCELINNKIRICEKINNKWESDFIDTTYDVARGQISIGDVDNDGDNEIVVANINTPSGYAINAYKKIGTIWHESLITYTSSAKIDIGDADNDGKNELIVGYYNRIRSFHNVSGSWMMQNITDVYSDSINSIEIVDLNNDNKNEIVMGMNHEIRMYKRDGGWLESILVNSTDIYGYATIGDTDDDGKINIVDQSSRIFEFDGGNWVEEEYLNNSFTEIAIADVDNDGFNDIGLGDNGPSGFYGYKKENGLWEIERTTLDPVWSMAAGDVDNDGTIEFIAGCSDDVRIYYFVPAQLPSEPINLVANSGDSYVLLNWEAPISDGDSSVINYSVYRGSLPGDDILIHSLNPIYLYYNDTDVVNGQNYHYYIVAVNKVGMSNKSNSIISTPHSLPSFPLNLISETGYLYVNLSWSAPIDNGGFPIINYTIYRNAGHGLDILTTIGNILNYTDTNISIGQDYYYRVSAHNKYGEGPISDEQKMSALSSDIDADGMNDTWEVEYFGDLDHIGDEDYDNDNYSNQEEFQAGTDPSDILDYPINGSTDGNETENETPGFGFGLIFLATTIAIIIHKKRK